MRILALLAATSLALQPLTAYAIDSSVTNDWRAQHQAKKEKLLEERRAKRKEILETMHKERAEKQAERANDLDERLSHIEDKLEAIKTHQTQQITPKIATPTTADTEDFDESDPLEQQITKADALIDKAYETVDKVDDHFADKEPSENQEGLYDKADALLEQAYDYLDDAEYNLDDADDILDSGNVSDSDKAEAKALVAEAVTLAGKAEGNAQAVMGILDSFKTTDQVAENEDSDNENDQNTDSSTDSSSEQKTAEQKKKEEKKKKEKQNMIMQIVQAFMKMMGGGQGGCKNPNGKAGVQQDMKKCMMGIAMLQKYKQQQTNPQDKARVDKAIAAQMPGANMVKGVSNMGMLTQILSTVQKAFSSAKTTQAKL